MTLTIGRVSLDESFTINQNGDGLSLEGLYQADDAGELNAVRQQVLGLAGNVDEPVVPVTSSDSQLDGFYRVQASSFEKARGGSTLLQGSWQVGLERVSDYAAPLIESILLGPDVRDNDFSLTEANVGSVSHTWWIPDAVTGIVLSSGSAPSEDGGLRRLSSNNIKDSRQNYLLAPSVWYDSSSRLLVDYGDDDVFRPVVGRQVINLPDADRWQLTNGRLRVTGVSGAEMRFTLELWLDSGAWSTPKSFEFLVSIDDDNVEYPDTLTVLRNGPELVVVRLTGGGGDTVGLNTVSYNMDLALRRGANHVEAVAARYGVSASFAWQAGVASAEAATEHDIALAITKHVGIRATNPDGEDVIYVIVTPKSYTADTTNGRVELGTESSAPFGIGLVENAASSDAVVKTAGAGFTASYFSPITETVRVVER